MHTIPLNLYEFKELSKEAQERAISDHIEFEIEIMDKGSPYYDIALEMDKMQTPWFLGSEIYNCHKDDIIESILINDYLFFDTGELIPLELYPKEECQSCGVKFSGVTIHETFICNDCK